MMLQHVNLVFVYSYLFIVNFQADGTLSPSTLAKTRRTQSMRPLSTVHRTENILRTQSDTLSAISSSSLDLSMTGSEIIDSRPIASSSSSARQIDTSVLKEVELTPLIEKTKRVNFINTPNLHEASVATYSDGNINPARDSAWCTFRPGVLSRVKKILQYGSLALAGSAIGAGGVKFAQSLNENKNKKNQTFTSTTVSNGHNVITTDTNSVQRTKTDFDNLENLF